MTSIDIAAARQALLTERNRLVHSLAELGANENGDLAPGRDFGGAFADAGAATAERTETLGLVDSLKAQLDDIDAALAAIETGTYGVCTSCGNRISPARLEARPMSLLCVGCKSKQG